MTEREEEYIKRAKEVGFDTSNLGKRGYTPLRIFVEGYGASLGYDLADLFENRTKRDDDDYIELLEQLANGNNFIGIFKEGHNAFTLALLGSLTRKNVDIDKCLAEGYTVLGLTRIALTLISNPELRLAKPLPTKEDKH